MKILILILFISISPAKQENFQDDNLLTELENASVERKMRIYKELCWNHRNNSPSQALEYGQKALELAQLIGNKKEEASIYNYLGIIKRNQYEYPEALDFFYKALTLSEEVDSKIEIGYALNNLGDIHNRKSEDSLAFSYFTRAYKVFILTGNERGLAYCYNQLSNHFMECEEYDSAFYYNNKSLKIRESINDLDGTANSYRNIGDIYIEKENYDSARFYILRAFEIDTAIDNQSSVIKDYYLLGRLSNRMGLYMDAIEYLNLSKEVGDSIESEFTLINIYNELNFTYKELNDFEKAYGYYEIYNELNDRLHNEEKYKIQVQLAMQYEFDKEQEQKEIRAKEVKRRQTFLRYLLISIILVILIILIVIYKAYQLIQKTNKKLLSKNKIIVEQKNELEDANNQLIKDEKIIKESNDTKDKFFSIIAHDLRSPFTSILGYTEELHQSYENYDDKQKKEFIKYLNIAAGNTYNLLQNLLDWARSQSNNMQIKLIKQDINELIYENIDLLQIKSKEKSISVSFHAVPNTIVNIDIQMINTVIRNLLSNAIKFTYPEGEINISTSVQDEKVYVSIQDNGIGIKEADIKKLFKTDQHFRNKGTQNESGTGLGLILTKEFVDKNGGEITVISEEGKGSRFSFSLPLTKS